MPWFSEKSDRISPKRVQELMQTHGRRGQKSVVQTAPAGIAFAARHHPGPFQGRADDGDIV